MELQSEFGAAAIIDYLPEFEKNKISISRLSKASANVGNTVGYGVKYVIKGTENYLVNNNRYSVQAGQYLLVNKDQDLSVDFKSKTTVYGLCISLDEELLGNIYATLLTPESALLDYPQEQRVLPEFHETIYSGRDPLSVYLKSLVNVKEEYDPSRYYEIYQNISYHLLASQKLTAEQIEKINASKPSTKKELFTRLNTAKALIDLDCSRNFTINELAKESTLSKFHFYRSFKEAFKLSPYQYILVRRLETAKDLLLKNEFSVTHVAFLTGFSDIYSFSRAFKKHFKISPQKI